MCVLPLICLLCLSCSTIRAAQHKYEKERQHFHSWQRSHITKRKFTTSCSCVILLEVLNSASTLPEPQVKDHPHRLSTATVLFCQTLHCSTLPFPFSVMEADTQEAASTYPATMHEHFIRAACLNRRHRELRTREQPLDLSQKIGLPAAVPSVLSFEPEL